MHVQYVYMYLVEKQQTPPDIAVVPVKVLIDLGSLLQVARVPVVRQVVFGHQVFHDGNTV